ncbi:MAG: hydrogenase subunit MbhD domain-containing protein [Eubacteriales bacterium]
MMMFEMILLVFLLLCAIAVCLTKNLLSSVIIYMSYSAVMSILWILLRAPDLAITEAAVGVGVTSTLFFITLFNINKLKDEGEEDE